MYKGKYYNLMIVPDGVESPFGIRMRAWMFKALIAFVSIVLVGLILFFAFYGKILSRAALTGQLEIENEELKRYKLKKGIKNPCDQLASLIQRKTTLFISSRNRYQNSTPTTEILMYTLRSFLPALKTEVLRR